MPDAENQTPPEPPAMPNNEANNCDCCRYEIYQLHDKFERDDDFLQWLDLPQNNIPYTPVKEHSLLPRVSGGFKAFYDSLEIKIKSSEDKRTHLYSIFGEPFTVYLLLTTRREEFQAQFNDQIGEEGEGKKITKAHRHIIVSHERKRDALITRCLLEPATFRVKDNCLPTSAGAQIVFGSRGMHIGLCDENSHANEEECRRVLPRDPQNFADDAQAAIHCYVLALAFNTRHENSLKEARDNYKEEREMSIICNKIHEFNLKYFYTTPVKPIHREILDLWEKTALHTNVQGLHNEIEKRVIASTKRIESMSSARRAVNMLAFAFIGVLWYIIDTPPSLDGKFVSIIIAAFLFLILWTLKNTLIFPQYRSSLWDFELPAILLGTLLCSIWLHQLFQQKAREPTSTVLCDQTQTCIQHPWHLHTTINPYSTANNCCGWCVDYGITRNGGDATETGGFYPRHTHTHQHQ